MKARDLGELVVLGALWGASFLFMRIASPEFGAVPLAATRVLGAALLLLPLLMVRRGLGDLRRHWRTMAVVGASNSALPFAFFAYAALSLNAGVSAILNATAPLFGAVIAALWWRQPTGTARLAGLLIGFAGVAWLVWDQAGLKPGASGAGVALAIGLCLAASALYGFSANFIRHRLAGAAPLAVAAGSQLSAALLLSGPAIWAWPGKGPSGPAWSAALALALLCTGLAYILYFRLIARAGPANAIAVTYLVPPFALVWGAVFLDEALSPDILAGCVVILLGTALATGVLELRRQGPAAT